MLGLGRLFADDTSIGHTAHDETTLKNMINIDLKYTCCTGKIIRPYPSPFLVSSPVAFKFFNVLVLNIAEKMLVGR
jgi:hypothetical protein